jgi:hypothetical protein
VIRQRFAVLNWPPHIPDLSPIEMISAIIKHTLKNQHFITEADLFAALEAEWYSINQGVIDNMLSSFRARCQVCVAHNGKASTNIGAKYCGTSLSRSTASSSRTAWNRIKVNSIFLKMIGTMKKLHPFLQLNEI